ncbi:MAG TPA: NAD(P)H-dependent glycerol-3-phosphate dehydrogenase [Bacteroidetes bacterium]|nr:NAD(P)H-dependent glycerol-3-phosphate dehydrogenase [Bacteroidota bacterium]
MAKIGVLGAGSWGTALAVLLSAKHEEIVMWEFFPEIAEKLQIDRENKRMLPGVKIPDNIKITSRLPEAVEGMEVLLSAVPSHVVRQLATLLKEFPVKDKIIVSVTKGIENDSLFRVAQIYRDVLPDFSPDHFVVLSGPSHAEEVSRGVPTTVVAAGSDLPVAKQVQNIFMTATFRVYSHTDVVGVELGGSLKNVIAIAAGIGDGVGFGDNTKAALMTRGIAEITRLGTALGADPLTFAGLSGIGDLIVTCMSRHSRNRYVGEEIGKGKTLDEVLSQMVMVAEGVRTARSVFELAKLKHVEMPISEEVYRVLFENKDPKTAVYDLMTRDAKQERFGV